MVALIDADIIPYVVHYSSYNNGTSSIEKMTDSLMNKIFLETGCSKYIGYLTGKNNYRKDVAVTREYKGSRKKKEISEEINQSKAHLHKHWKCFYVNGGEADDALGISQIYLNNNKIDSIICTRDKDLLQIPGKHYNFFNKELVVISPQEAEYNLYYQIIRGDSTDDIEGVRGYGDKTTRKFLEKNKGNEENAIKDLYIKCYGITEGVERFYETIKLVYIQKRNKSFKVPDPISIYKYGSY